MSSTVTREQLANLYPEKNNEILGITNEELNNINQALNGAVDIKVSMGSTICLTTFHVMHTTNAPNEGLGTHLPEDARGYRFDPIPKFQRETQYSVTLEGNNIILIVKGVAYTYKTVDRLQAASATGRIVN